MTAWYNDPDENFAASKIGNLIDTDSTNSRVDFSEGVFKLSEDGKQLDCFLQATNVSDCVKVGEKGWTFKPCLIYFRLHAESYEKYGKDKKKTTVEPKPFTKWLFKEITALIAATPDKPFLKGFIQFTEPSHSQAAEAVLSGMNTNGKPLTDDMVDYLRSSCFEFESVAELKEIDPSKLPEIKAWKSFGSAKQSEKDRLNDRLAFLKSLDGNVEFQELTKAYSAYFGNDPGLAFIEITKILMA